MHILHCTPLGTSMFNDFIRRLQDAGILGEAERTALVLPSPYLLERARAELRLTDVPAWEFPHILSLDELAGKLSGMTKISRLEQELLISGIMKESSVSGQYPYFDKIADFPGLVAALARLFDELKMAAVTPEELEMTVEALSGEVERNFGRDESIVGLYRSYQEILVENSLMDVGGMYRLAMDALDREEQPLPFSRILLSEFSILSPLRLQFIGRLKRRIPMEIGICFEKNRPGVFRAVEPIYHSLVGMGFMPVFREDGFDISPALRHLSRNLFLDRPERRHDAAGIHIRICPNRSKELSVAADNIKTLLLQKRYLPHEVAVVIHDPDAYSYLRAVFDERGIPVDNAESMPCQERALPRLVLSWLDMLKEQGRRASVLSVLKSPYLKDRLKVDANRLEKCLLGEVIRGWGDWIPAMERRSPDENTGKSWQEGWMELRQQSAGWSGKVSWEKWAALLRDLLSWIDVPAVLGRCRLDGTLSLFEVRAELQGLQTLLEAAEQIEKLAAVPGQSGDRVDTAEFSDVLCRLLEGSRVSLSNRQASGVQVVTPETASGMNFRAVFVLGLAEGAFPSPPRESWLYSDRERQALGEAGVFLQTSEDRTALADFAFSLAVGMASEELFLSALTDSETLPSRFLAEAIRLFSPEGIETETFGPHQVVAETPDEVRSYRGLEHGALYHVWHPTGGHAAWETVYPALGSFFPAGLEKKAALEEARKGPHAGLIDSSLIQLERVSPSALELYAACPFSYFVAEVMRISPWDEAQEGFDALSSGSVWHEVLASFLSRYRGRKLDPKASMQYLHELIRQLEITVSAYERQGRIIPDVWWRYEKPRWEKALRDWLDAELARQSDTEMVPCFFEWAFGSAKRSGSDPKSSEQPLVLAGEDDGEQVELQGKVDRIDADETHCRVIDYKTGKAPARKQVEKGLRLQVPLYMMAAEALLCREGKRVEEGMYLPVGAASSVLVLPGSKMSKEELFDTAKQYVIRYVSGIRGGKFPAQPAGGCPPYCMSRNFCRMEEAPDGDGAEESSDE